MWRWSTGERLAVLAVGKRRLLDAAFGPNRKLVVTANEDGSTRIWQWSTGDILRNSGGRKRRKALPSLQCGVQSGRRVRSNCERRQDCSSLGVEEGERCSSRYVAIVARSWARPLARTRGSSSDLPPGRATTCRCGGIVDDKSEFKGSRLAILRGQPGPCYDVAFSPPTGKWSRPPAPKEACAYGTRRREELKTSKFRLGAH